jgi:SAM-dependent methyltransferase
VTDHRRHPMRLLTRLEGRVPALHRLLTRSHARRFDGLAHQWDTIRADASDSERMLERALDDLAVTAPARVLDVGTGTGQAAAILARRFPGARIDAVDASSRMIELARAKPELSGVRFAVADGGDLPFADATFDLTVSLLVHPFEHELRRVLAPGGWALFCYPMGPGTPIWFPSSLVAPRLERAGFAEVRAGTVGVGEWTAGRRESGG